MDEHHPRYDNLHFRADRESIEKCRVFKNRGRAKQKRLALFGLQKR